MADLNDVQVLQHIRSSPPRPDWAEAEANTRAAYGALRDALTAQQEQLSGISMLMPSWRSDMWPFLTYPYFHKKPISQAVEAYYRRLTSNIKGREIEAALNVFLQRLAQLLAVARQAWVAPATVPAPPTVPLTPASHPDAVPPVDASLTVALPPPPEDASADIHALREHNATLTQQMARMRDHLLNLIVSYRQRLQMTDQPPAWEQHAPESYQRLRERERMFQDELEEMLATFFAVERAPILPGMPFDAALMTYVAPTIAAHGDSVAGTVAEVVSPCFRQRMPDGTTAVCLKAQVRLFA